MNWAPFSTFCSHFCSALHTLMSIKGEGKTGLKLNSPFRQMRKGGGKRCGSNAEQLLAHKERKGGKGRPESTIIFLLPTSCVTALALLKTRQKQAKKKPQKTTKQDHWKALPCLRLQNNSFQLLLETQCNTILNH